MVFLSYPTILPYLCESSNEVLLWIFSSLNVQCYVDYITDFLKPLFIKAGRCLKEGSWAVEGWNFPVLVAL